MSRILITGATGNVGMEVIKALHRMPHSHTVQAGVRDVKAAASLSAYNVQGLSFDFENDAIQTPALQQTDMLFLMRPPQLANVNKQFQPLLDRAKEAGVQHIVFLSVQGVEGNRFIPHHKIEAAIRASNIPFTFLRPAYFMQNFTTTLRADLVHKRLIFLPAGNAPFTLVDVVDIGEAAARILCEPQAHAGKAYDLTCDERHTFAEIATILSEVLEIPIRYLSPGLLQFYRTKRKEGFTTGYILVLIMLHYLPRFQKEPPISQSIWQLTGRAPTSFRQFAERHKAQLLADKVDRNR